jgi:predicted aspartyl protease
VSLAGPGQAPGTPQLVAVIDTGADGTLVPTSFLEAVEAIGVGDAVLRSVLGEIREVHLFEVDLRCGDAVLPGVLVAGDESGTEILLGRNVLNKLILLLDGHSLSTELLDKFPKGSSHV